MLFLHLFFLAYLKTFFSFIRQILLSILIKQSMIFMNLVLTKTCLPMDQESCQVDVVEVGLGLRPKDW